MAIDDVEFHNCALYESVPGTCNFEHGGCGYKEFIVDDDFNWQLQQGPTPSYYTGPDADHTYGNASGHYYYTEASAPRVNGDIATLNSPWFVSQDSQCLFTFFYHMKLSGSDPDTKLVVKQRYDTMEEKSVGVFNSSAEDWQRGSATVSLGGEVAT